MAAEALTDQEQQFRKRARRRLIGAVALVLLMVTVLPMLLDDRSEQAPHPDVAISIPSQDDGNFASKIVPTAPPAPPAPPVANVVPVTPDAAPSPSPAALPQPVAAPVIAEPKTESKVEPKPEPKPKVEPKPKAEPKSESKPKPEPKSEPAKPVVKEQLKPEPKAAPAAPAKNEGVSIQVGVFSDSDKVTQMKNKAGSLGVKCSTEPLNTKTGAKVRMRCGPYGSRAEAEKAQESLKSAGINNTILVSHQ